MTTTTRFLGLGFLTASMLLSAAEKVPQQRACNVDSESGAEVCQITSAGMNTIYYYDTPAYSAKYKKIVYLNMNSERGRAQIVVANPDGSDAEVLVEGKDQMVSPDGSKVYYRGRNPGESGQDLYGIDLGTRRITRITHANVGGQPFVYNATASPNGNLLVYNSGNTMHRIFDDGHGDTVLKLGDPNPDAPFHRIRISPAKPNLILYNRPVAGTEKPLWVYDVSTGKTYKAASRASHMMWAPDGEHIAHDGGSDYRLHLVRYDGTGDIVLDGKDRLGTEYCSWAPEGDALACANVDKDSRVPFPSSIYLLAADGSNKVVYVGKHASQAGHYWGFPALQFMGDRYHILFRSDATGQPQVYTVTLPKSIYERMAPVARAEAAMPKTGETR